MVKLASPLLKFSDFLKSLDHNSPLPLYLFHGDEPFFIQKGLNIIKEKFAGSDFDVLNVQTLFGHEVSANELINACQTMPFLSENRIVVLKGLDKMSSGEQETLIPYFQNPSPSTLLLLTAEKIDLRKKTCHAIQAHGGIVSCSPPYESQIPFWIRTMAGSINLTLTDEAVIELKERLGNNLLRIQTELEKISLYHLTKKGKLRREDITVVLGGEKEHSIFDLTRAIGQKDFEGAVKTLKRVLENGEHPLMVLTFLIRQYRLIWKTKDLMSKGVPKEEISKKLGVHPFYGQTLQNQARLYSEEQLQESFMMFKEADSALKESFHNPRFFLERLTFFLCQPTKAPFTPREKNLGN